MKSRHSGQSIFGAHEHTAADAMPAAEWQGSVVTKACGNFLERNDDASLISEYSFKTAHTGEVVC